MADLSITAANVSPSSNVNPDSSYTAGVSITAGESIYIDSSDSDKAKLAQSDGTEAEADVKGIALNTADAGQPIALAKSGDMDIGATLTVGETYVLSRTAGGVAPIGDLATGDYVTHVGVATAADTLHLRLYSSATEVP